MPEIQYPTNPNSDTAFVVQDDGKKNRALMIAPQDISTLELPNNPNSTKGYVTIDGKKHRVNLVADITGGGGGGSSLPDQTGHSGEFLTTDGTDASWAAVESLPTQTGNAGKFLTTDGTDASWSDKPLVNQTTSTSGGTGKPIYVLNDGKGVGLNLQDTESCIVGSTNNHPGNYGTSFGIKSGAQSGTAIHGVMIGYSQTVTATGAIQIGGYSANNPDSNTFKVANANGNFEIMSADGTIPAARHAALPASDGTYVLKCVISGGVATLSWVAE